MHKNTVQTQFGASADAYATSDIHARGESLDLLLESIPCRDTWLALDVATGAGHTALAFANRVAAVFATDLTPSMVKKAVELAAARQLDNVFPCLADAEKLPFVDAAIDLLTCRLAFHHFPDPHAAAAEFFRVLKPGGRLGFTDNFVVSGRENVEYYNTYETIRDPSHFWVYPLQELVGLIESSGFSVKLTRRLSKEFEFHAWADRQHVSAADKSRLLDLMRQAPPDLQSFFSPRWEKDTMYFSLWETVIVADKTN